MTESFKPLNDAGVPADGSFDFSAALDNDPLMPKYSPPEVSSTGHKVHRKLLQAQQLANNHLEVTGNLPYFVAAAEYVDTRDVREQELSGAEEVDEVDVVVYVLSKDMDNQTGAAVRLPPGRIDGSLLREMLDDAMVYVMKNVKRTVTAEADSEPARDTAVPVADEESAQPTGGEDGDFDPFEETCCSLGTCYQDYEWPEGEDAQDHPEDEVDEGPH